MPIQSTPRWQRSSSWDSDGPFGPFMQGMEMGVAIRELPLRAQTRQLEVQQEKLRQDAEFLKLGELRSEQQRQEEDLQTWADWSGKSWKDRKDLGQPFFKSTEFRKAASDLSARDAQQMHYDALTEEAKGNLAAATEYRNKRNMIGEVDPLLLSEVPVIAPGTIPSIQQVEALDRTWAKAQQKRLQTVQERTDRGWRYRRVQNPVTGSWSEEWEPPTQKAFKFTPEQQSEIRRFDNEIQDVRRQLSKADPEDVPELKEQLTRLYQEKRIYARTIGPEAEAQLAEEIKVEPTESELFATNPKAYFNKLRQEAVFEGIKRKMDRTQVPEKVEQEQAEMLARIDMEEAKLEGRVLDKSSNTISKILKQHGIAKEDWDGILYPDRLTPEQRTALEAKLKTLVGTVYADQATGKPVKVGLGTIQRWIIELKRLTSPKPTPTITKTPLPSSQFGPQLRGTPRTLP